MSQQFVAFLRGINVGGNKKISMTKLKEVFESSGFTQVKTYINSGNVLFHLAEKNSSNLSQKIEIILKHTFGFEISVVVRDAENIQFLANKIPTSWKNNTEMKTDILFLTDAFRRKETIDLIKTNPEVDRLLYIDGAIIWNIDRNNYSQSGMSKFIGTTVYKNMTARNVNTVHKLALLLDSKSTKL